MAAVSFRNAGLRAFAAVSLLLAAGAAAFGDAGLGRHKKMYAVPVPGKVTIDGKLNDWDLSAQILMYVVSETSEMQGAKFALMYDADALYLSAEVRDPSPMMNRHDPMVDADWGWNGDSCQFRMVLDASQPYPATGSCYGPKEQNRNDQMAHLTLWHYTDRQEPAMHMLFGMAYEDPKAGYKPKGVVPRSKYQAKYLKSADGRGYTFEHRIPWSTLEARKPPKAGDLVAGTVQFNWSEATGMQTAGGAAWAYDVMAGPGFTFQNAGCWGKIIFSEKGNLPKEMVEEGLPPEQPLPCTFEYDLPEDGEVTIALFDDANMVARSLVCQGARRAGKNIERWDGLDDNGMPMLAGTYTWRGLCHKPITTKYLFSVHNSGQPGHKTDDNTGGWGGDHGWPTTVCALPDGMILCWHVCESGWGIIKTDLNGKKLWGSKHNAKHIATDGSRLFVAGDEGYSEQHFVKVFDLKDCCPMTWGNGKTALLPPPGGDDKTDIARGVAYSNGVVYVSWTARNLVGLYDAKSGDLKESWTVPAPGELAVRPDGSVLAVSGSVVVALAKGKAEKLVGDHLDSPTGIAVGKDGTIFVANQGALQNVSVFAADGRYLRSIGKEGGRPRQGAYDKTGMLQAAGIGLDTTGRLWIAENIPGPKRISVWDTQTGENVNEFFGGSAYSTFTAMDPDRPDEIYCENVLWKIDFDKKTWKPVSTHWRPVDPNSPSSEGCSYGGFKPLTAKNGKQYAWASNYAKGNCLFIREGGVFKPYILPFRSTNDHEPTPWPAFPLMGDIKEYPNGNYLWVDRNADGLIQKEEITKHEAFDFHWVDKELNLWSANGSVLRPIRIEPDGRPVYDFTKVQRLPVRGSASMYPIVVDAQDGSLFTVAQDFDPGLAHYTPDGKLLWGYRGSISWPRALSKPPAQPGKLWGPTCLLGVAGDFVGVAVYFGVFHVYTRDGLYVAMLFKDSRTSGGLGPEVNACETFTGQIVKPAGMNRYFLLNGDQDGRVSEIVGLDTIKRLAGGKYAHSAEDAKKSADALAEYERLKARGQRLDVVRGKSLISTCKGITKFVDSERNFTARTAYDEKNLYVAFDVTSKSELLNAANDPRLIFKGGNCIDVQIAADPAADPKSKTPAPGDVRILVTRRDGQPAAVVYRPKVKGFSGERIILTSPANKEPFDAIEQTDKVGLEYTKGEAGFRALVTVPLDLLGWTPKPGENVRMDLGYVFGNPTGTQALMRSYWTNNSFSANVLNDVPNESRLEPAEWGLATVE